MNLIKFEKLRRLLLDEGADAVLQPGTRIAQEKTYELFYVPFEHVNDKARLVVVGITPGMNQLKLAYAEAQRLLALGMSDAEVLRGVKSAAAFGGEAMRPNLLRMLRHFGIAEILGIEDERDLWGSRADLLQSTSVVPHAAFRAEKMFSGSFDEILRTRALRCCFEEDFVPTLARIPRDALYVALGPTPLDALDWCVARGLMGEEQVLGALAHPSSSSGSQVSVYLGEKSPADLDPKDPVRHRVEWLINAHARMRFATDVLRQAGGGHRGDGRCEAPQLPAAGAPATASVLPAPHPSGGGVPARDARGPARREGEVGLGGALPHVLGLHYVVSRGKAAGTVLRPHVQDGHHIVSPTRYETDYVRVPVHEQLETYFARGLSLRMSAPGVAPSLISPGSIRGRDQGRT